MYELENILDTRFTEEVCLFISNSRYHIGAVQLDCGESTNGTHFALRLERYEVDGPLVLSLVNIRPEGSICGKIFTQFIEIIDGNTHGEIIVICNIPHRIANENPNEIILYMIKIANKIKSSTKASKVADIISFLRIIFV